MHTIAKPLHIVGLTHVWQVQITNKQDQLIWASQLTEAVLEKRKPQ